MRRIKLTQGRYTLVDNSDFEELSKHKWCALRLSYGGFVAVRSSPTNKNGKRGLILMHREIMNCPKDLDVDHRNHNTLDNQKHNLRICTRSQNKQNGLPRKDGTSQYKGVHWYKASMKWTAQIRMNKKRMHLGCFDDEIEAACAYDQAAQRYFGEFAYLNFPQNLQKI